MKQPPPFIYVVVVEGPPERPWSRTHTYQPKKDGSPPRAMLDELVLWKPKPWVARDKQATVTTTVYRYNLEGVIEVDSPEPEPIHIAFKP